MKNDCMKGCGGTNCINYATATQDWKTKCKSGMSPISTQWTQTYRYI